MTDSQDEIKPLAFPGLTPITEDNDGDPALLDNIPGRQAGTPLKELLFNPIIKKVNQLVKAANDGITNIRGYLPLTGGTLSGILSVPDFVENQDNSSVLNVRSSDKRYQKAGYFILQNDPDAPLDKNGCIGAQWAGYRESDGTFRLYLKAPGVPSRTVSIGLPVGSIIGWPSWNIPEGWLPLLGQDFDPKVYPALSNDLKGNKLPDWRGRFPRMISAGSPIGAPDGIGTHQQDSMRPITGWLYAGSDKPAANGWNRAGGVFNWTLGNDYGIDAAQGGSQGTYDFDSSRQVPTDNEIRPYSVISNFIIKAL